MPWMGRGENLLTCILDCGLQVMLDVMHDAKVHQVTFSR